MSLRQITLAKRIIQTGLLVLVVAGFAGMTTVLRAQDQAAPAQAQQTEDTAKPPQQPTDDASKAQDAAKPPEDAAHQPDASQPPSMPQQLVRGEREAVGQDKEEEKDEKAEFKRSPSVRWMARKFGISPERASLLSVLLNFAVIAGILVWAGSKALPGAFRDRTASIQKAMQEAQKASDEARRRLAEIESRLKKLDVEIETMRDAAEKEAAAEEARIHAAAEEDARKIILAAEQEVAAAIKSARRELTSYAADLAVALAQKQIHVDAATDQAIVRNFSGQLGTAPGAGKDGH